MIMSRAIRKIFITSMAMFIIVTVFSIPMVQNSYNVPVTLEFEEVTSISTNSIYLKNKNGYLVKANILLEEDSIKKNVEKILNNLIVSKTNKFSNGLSGTIPENVKVREVICGSELVTINFSKEFLDVSVSDERKMLQSIVYSILDIEDIKGVSILVEGKAYDKSVNTNEEYPLVFDKGIGINDNYEVKSREDINKVVIYYLERIEDDIYYVPVTKYVNDDREKIKIIVEELTTSYIYEENLMSFLNSKTRLIDYTFENDVAVLNFNEYLFDYNDKVLEEVIYTIGYSVLDNYDVDMVMFEVRGEEVGYLERK